MRGRRWGPWLSNRPLRSWVTGSTPVPATGSGATARAEGGHIPTNICCIISTPQICGPPENPRQCPEAGIKDCCDGAGRRAMTDEMQALCFFAGADSIFVGETLLPADYHCEDQHAARAP